MAKAKRKGFKIGPKAKKWIVTIAIVVLCGILVVMGLNLNKLNKTKEVSATWGWEQGLLAEDGSEVKGTTAIRTKEYVTLDGFTVEIGEDASITYQLFFYDAEEAFIEASTELSVDYDAATASVPEKAETVRIMITPENDPEVSTTEIAKYARELVVAYSR